MKFLLKFLGQLGEKTTRTDLWTLCALTAFIWSMVKWDTDIMLWIMGFMFADLGVEKYTDVQKVKHYAENIRENQSSTHSTAISVSNNSTPVDENQPTTE